MKSANDQLREILKQKEASAKEAKPAWFNEGNLFKKEFGKEEPKEEVAEIKVEEEKVEPLISRRVKRTHVVKQEKQEEEDE